jgi:hypothetical protein
MQLSGQSEIGELNYSIPKSYQYITASCRVKSFHIVRRCLQRVVRVVYHAL